MTGVGPFAGEYRDPAPSRTIEPVSKFGHGYSRAWSPAKRNIAAHVREDREKHRWHRLFGFWSRDQVGLVDRNPVTDGEPPVPKKPKGIALAPSKQAIASASGPWCMRMFLEMAAGTGCRRGEVLALRWQDINDGRATVARSLTQTKHLLAFKDTKSENIHVVTLPQSTLTALELHRERQKEFARQFGPSYRSDLDLIFVNPDGTPFKSNSISAIVSALCHRLKLPRGVSLYSLRHTHGSHLLASGVPLPAVSERLGHSSVRVTTDFYSHAIHGQDDEAAKRWDQFQNVAVSRPKPICTRQNYRLARSIPVSATNSLIIMRL